MYEVSMIAPLYVQGDQALERVSNFAKTNTHLEWAARAAVSTGLILEQTCHKQIGSLSTRM